MRYLAAVPLALLAAATGRAQSPPADPPSDAKKAAEKLVGKIDLEAFADGRWAAVKRVEKPLLYYGDATRGNDRGSVWAWGETGRPAALLELFQSQDQEGRWVAALCNTSGRKVRATLGGKPWWAENASAAELKDIPGAPPPAADAGQRQRQLKLLAGKFAGHEFWEPNNSRYELRRLDRPLHTYRDEAGGLTDGGLYTLANGTNPELMLFLEARTDPADGNKAVWQYAVGRLAHAELHLAYDGKEVFTAPRGDQVSGRDKPYWLSLIAGAPADKR